MVGCDTHLALLLSISSKNKIEVRATWCNLGSIYAQAGRMGDAPHANRRVNNLNPSFLKKVRYRFRVGKAVSQSRSLGWHSANSHQRCVTVGIHPLESTLPLQLNELLGLHGI
jgi:hypothetical protein